MHYTFGWYLFSARDVPVAGASRETTIRTARHEPAFGPPVYQFQGVGDDKITLSGIVAPGINGETERLEVLRQILLSGKTYPLIQGDGSVMGRFFIESLSETHTQYWPNGEPKEVGFEIALIRDHDPQNAGALSDSVGSGIADG